MTFAFYLAGGVAVVATFLVITRANAVHALLYLVVSLLAVAVVFLTLGAPFAAALEVIIYAGAIMVLFVFVIMILSMGRRAVEQEKQWLTAGAWLGPSLLTLILVAELIYVIGSQGATAMSGRPVSPAEVAERLLGPYLLGVELASMLLLAGLVGAYHLAHHLGRKEQMGDERGRMGEGSGEKGSRSEARSMGGSG